MSGEEYQDIHELPEWDQVEPYLLASQDEEAIAAIRQHALPRVTAPLDRSEYFSILGSLLALRATEERMAGRLEQAESLRDEARQAFITGIDECPYNLGSRIALGQFMLIHGDLSDRTIHYLDAPQGMALVKNPGKMESYRHQLAALRGAAQIMLGSLEEGMDALENAYGEPFRRVLREPETTPLLCLKMRGIRLPAERLEIVFAAIRKFDSIDRHYLDGLQAALRE